MDSIKLENFDLIKDNKKILSNIDFLFDTNISLIGTSNSGKTSLLKVLEDKYKVPRIYKEYTFYASSIEDELKYLILDMDKKKLIQDLLPNINLMKHPNELKHQEKIKINIIKGLINSNGYVSFDNILIYVNDKDRKIIFDYINKNNIKYIITSNDLNELFNTKRTYILNEGSVIAYGDSDKMLLEEKLLKRLGFKLPFMIDLSLQLKAYKLVNNIYYDKQLLIDKLWK